MARLPSHRLDLAIVPNKADASAARPGLAHLVHAGFTTADGRSGERAAELVDGGFVTVRLDFPGRRTLYANSVGGFRVCCPRSGDSIVPAFHAAMARFRVEPDTALECPACGEAHDLNALDFQPPAAFGSWACLLVDAGSFALTPQGLAAVRAIWGDVRVIPRRVGSA